MKDPTDHRVDVYMTHANRLLRMFTAQVEALKKYRSNGEQHCTVETYTYILAARPLWAQ